MPKSRMEAFSDGVIAIILTIMVLELHAPSEATIAALKPILHTFFSYILSFVYIAIFWNNHHHLLCTAKRVNGAILWANIHLLFWLSLVPFATDWVGDTHGAPWPTACYGIVLFMAALAWSILERVIAVEHDKDCVLRRSPSRVWKVAISPICYLAAIGFAFVSSWISNALYVFVALLWIVPDPDIERALKS